MTLRWSRWATLVVLVAAAPFSACSLVYGPNFDALRASPVADSDAAAGSDAAVGFDAGADQGSSEAGTFDSGIVEPAVRCVDGGSSCVDVLTIAEPPVVDLVVHGSRLVWSSADGGIFTCAIDTCAETRKKLTDARASQLVVDDADVVYFADDAPASALRSCPLEGCAGAPTVVFADLTNARGPAFDGAWLYFSSGTQILRGKRDGSGKKVWVSSSAGTVRWVAAGSGAVLWVSVDNPDYPAHLWSGETFLSGNGTSRGRARLYPPAVSGAHFAFSWPYKVSLPDDGRGGVLYGDADTPLTSLNGTSELALDPTRVAVGERPSGTWVVAWLDRTKHAVSMCPSTGCSGPPAELARSAALDVESALTLTATHAYFREDASIVRVALP